MAQRISDELGGFRIFVKKENNLKKGKGRRFPWLDR